MLDAGSFSDRAVVMASTSFERVMINCTAPGNCFEKTAEGAALMKRFKVTGWPHVLFLDPQGDVIDRIRGRCPTEKYLESMDRIARRYAPQRRLEEVCAASRNGAQLKELARAAAGKGVAAERARAELRRLRDGAAAALAATGRAAPPK